MPKISIIIPVYNAEKFIEDTVKSVLSQDYKNFEIILINDASTDNSSEILKKFGKKESRIKIIDLKENKGRAKAVNEGFKAAKGEYIAFLDADDLMSEGRLKEQVDFLDINKEIDLVYGNMTKLWEDGTEEFFESIDFDQDPKKILLNFSKRKDLGEITSYKILDYKDQDKYIPGGTVMIRKKIIDSGIKCDENLRNNEDYDLWLQIIGKGFKIAKINKIFFIYRKHKGQKSKSQEKMLIAARYINEKLKKGLYFNK